MARFHFDPRFIVIESELSALEQFLERVEPTVAHLIADDEKRTWEELSEAGLIDDDAERSMTHKLLDERSERVFPRLLRGPFLVALWACYEWGVAEIAEARREALEIKIKIDELRSGNVLERAVRYFDAVLNTEFDTDSARLKRIGELYVVGNALAHAGGHKRAMSKDKWQRVCEILRPFGMEDPDQHRDIASIPASYLPAAFADVKESLNELVLRVRGGPAFKLLDPLNADEAD